MQEVDGTLARWVTGEIDDDDALRAICARLEGTSVTIGVVHHDGVHTGLVSSGGSSADATLFVHVATRCAPRRTLCKVGDDRWEQLLGADGAERRDDVAWVACEPAGSDGTSWAMLVTVGRSEASRDDALAIMPDLARACAPILARAGARTATAKLRHEVYGLLTAVTANVEYAAVLLDDAAFDQLVQAHAPTQRAALRQAIQHAADSATRLRARIDAMAKVCDRVEPR